VRALLQQQQQQVLHRTPHSQHQEQQDPLHSTTLLSHSQRSIPLSSSMVLPPCLAASRHTSSRMPCLPTIMRSSSLGW
jgi:hypothetical protein